METTYVHSASGVDVLKSLVLSRHATGVVAQDADASGAVIAALIDMRTTGYAELSRIDGVTVIGKRGSSKPLTPALVSLLATMGGTSGMTVSDFISYRYSLQPSDVFFCP